MTKPGTTGADLRLGVPALFTEGRFEQVLIMTFGADLEFYERVLRRHFGSYRNQIVLADGLQLDRTVASLADASTLRHFNRSWIAGPVRALEAAHAKLILLAGPESGLLLVGSGNLNLSGYAGAGECFTPYRWSPDESSDLAAFTTVRALTDGLGQRDLLDVVTRERLQVFWDAYDWWHSEPVSDGPVRHNLEVPLGEQFKSLIGGERVEELVVVAPFHDRKCAALARLTTELAPRRCRVLIQPRHASVDPKRLAAVAKQHPLDVFEIDAAGDNAGAYLHTKLILAKTRQRAICLTGSANCSMVALWARFPHANVEMGNLVVGDRTAFDHLLDVAVVEIRGPVDPLTVDVSLQEDSDEAPAGSDVSVDDLRWEAPVMSGRIHAVVSDPARVAIEVEGRAVPTVVALTPEADATTRFEATLANPGDVEIVDRVAVVVVRIDDLPAAPTVPYQLSRLREQDRRRVDTERLRHAARLELDDPDLVHALAALEEILVGENIARWSRGSDDPAPAEAGDAPTVAWDDIDWSAVRRHPRYAAYGTLGGLGAVGGSDLAVYLNALSQAVRELSEPESRSTASAAPARDPDDDDEYEADDNEVSGGLEGADIDDVIEDDVEQPSFRRRQSIAARNLRLIRNFVRRNLRVLDQPAFRAGVGAGVVIPNVIVLNWVCWWVATKDEDRPGELTDERLRLWRLLWGGATSSGYLDELDDEQRGLVLEHFDDQRFEVVTLASMSDIWAHSEYGDANYRALREVLRRAVCHPCWQVTVQHLEPAARLANGRPTTSTAVDAVSLAETLWDAACTPLGTTEAREVVAEVAGVSLNDVAAADQAVVVDATSAPRPVCELFVSSSLSAADVERALAAWRGVDDRDYYRLKWIGGVALYRRAEENGWLYTEADDEIVDLALIPADDPRWRIELDRLCEAAEQTASVAA